MITVLWNAMSCSLLYTSMMVSQMKTLDMQQNLIPYCMQLKAKQAINLSQKYILCTADLAT